MSEAAPPKPDGPRPGGKPPRPARKSRSPLRNYLLLLITGFALVVSWDEIGFFLFLMLMGGVLSYLGDQLGSYCGKQRLSILGLRPRYTAGLINLATGFVITGLTFGGALWVSEDVRVAVFRVSELRQQAASLQTQGRMLRGDLARVQGELDSAREAVDEATRRREAAEEERSALLAQTEQLAGANGELSARNAALTTSNAELEARREALSRSIQEKLVEIDRLNLALEKKETAPVVISRNQVLLDETVAVPLDVTTEALKVAVADLAGRIAARVQLLDVRFDQRASNYLARYGVAKVKSRLDQIQARVRGQVERGELSPTEVPKECHIAPVSTRNVSVGEPLTHIVFDVRANTLVVAAGGEVARTLVDGSLPTDQILDGLLYFDQQVRTVLREKGVSTSNLRRRGASSDPARLLELMRIAEAVRASEKTRVLLCKAAADIYAFGDTPVAFALEGEELVAPEAPPATPEPGVAPFALQLWDDPVQRGPELVLPEPTLSADTLIKAGAGSFGILEGDGGGAPGDGS